MTEPTTPTPRPNGANFHSSGLRQRVDQLMDILWAGGVNNPMDSIEQISHLLFLRLLSEREEMLATLDKNYRRIFSGPWAKYAWGNFVTLTGDALFDAVRSAIESIHDLPGLSQTGKLLFQRATLKVYDRPTLRAVIQTIHELDLEPHNGADFKGDMYEYLLGKINQSGTNGQFRTPRHIIDMIVALVDPQPRQRICDPAVGTAGFLISAYNHILNASRGTGRKNYPGGNLSQTQWRFLEEHAFTGYDNDANMVKIAILNLYLHRLEKARIELFNPLTTGKGGSYPGQQFDVILANPPFAGKIQKESILTDLNHGLNTRATEILFVQWMIDHLAPGGKAGIIVPNGVLSDETGAVKRIRSRLLNECALRAVISLPAGVFRPYADAETSVLVFSKPGPSECVWMYEVAADGFTLDDRRTPISQSDIPDLLFRWGTREEGENCFNVTIRMIRTHREILSPGLYKKDHLALTPDKLPEGWSLLPLNELVEEVSERAGTACSLPVLSVTKHEGFVDSVEYFRKRIFSEDTSAYKVVRRGQFAYSTIHLDEGSVAYLEHQDAGIISPMYKVFKIKEEMVDIIVHPKFLLRLLKSPALIEKYKSLGKGSVKRRKGIAFSAFTSIVIPLPDKQAQDQFAFLVQRVDQLKAELEKAEGDVSEGMTAILSRVGLW